MPKSSQAARNSCLSARRSSGSLRRQAGSIFRNVNLANVRSATRITLAVVVLVVGAGIPGGVSLNFFGAGAPGSGQEASLNFFGVALAADRRPGAEKVQDVS